MGGWVGGFVVAAHHSRGKITRLELSPQPGHAHAPTISRFALLTPLHRLVCMACSDVSHSRFLITFSKASIFGLLTGRITVDVRHRVSSSCLHVRRWLVEAALPMPPALLPLPFLCVERWCGCLGAKGMVRGWT